MSISSDHRAATPIWKSCWLSLSRKTSHQAWTAASRLQASFNVSPVGKFPTLDAFLFTASRSCQHANGNKKLREIRKPPLARITTILAQSRDMCNPAS